MIKTKGTIILLLCIGLLKAAVNITQKQYPNGVLVVKGQLHANIRGDLAYMKIQQTGNYSSSIKIARQDFRDNLNNTYQIIQQTRHVQLIATSLPKIRAQYFRNTTTNRTTRMFQVYNTITVRFNRLSASTNRIDQLRQEIQQSLANAYMIRYYLSRRVLSVYRRYFINVTSFQATRRAKYLAQRLKQMVRGVKKGKYSYLQISRNQALIKGISAAMGNRVVNFFAQLKVKFFIANSEKAVKTTADMMKQPSDELFVEQSQDRHEKNNNSRRW